MFMMGMRGHMSMMWCIIPTDNELILFRQPVGAIAQKLLPLPLFNDSQIVAILQIQDQAQGFTI